MHESLVTIILTLINEGEVFTGADKEYAYKVEAAENSYRIHERDDRGGWAENSSSREEMTTWLKHLPLSRISSQLQACLVYRGMEHLERDNHPGAFVLFTMASEHGMELGNLGLALLHFRQNNRDLAEAALGSVPVSTGIPYKEIPVRSFLIHGGLWKNPVKREQILKEFLSIDPDHRDVLELLEANASD